MAKSFNTYPKIIAYGMGMAGWSIMINIISVMIIYFYLPPLNSGLPVLIPQVGLFGIFTLFSLVLASGRIIDAVTDPLIAWFSDKSGTRFGRRIPFMLVSIIPSFVFCILIFFPRHTSESIQNYVWLFIMQSAFYFFLTLYSVPYNALMPELARTKDEKLVFSTVLSLMFVLGIIISSQIPMLEEFLQSLELNLSVTAYYQYSIILMAVLGLLFMLVPVLFVNEKKYCQSMPVKSSLTTSLFAVLKNRNFVIFVVADSAFFLTLALISSGVLYYVKVLLGLKGSMGSKVMGVMILLSLLFYPLVVRLARKYGKKLLIIFSFLLFALLFFLISGFGKYPIPPVYQLYIIAVLGAFPAAVLGILPFTIVAELASEDGIITGEQKEGMYYAARTFSDKLGQTFGVMVFAILTLFGKDVGNDLGIRLSALAGMGVCLLAGIIFLFFREIKKGSPN